MPTNEELRRLQQGTDPLPWRHIKDSFDPPEHWIVSGDGPLGTEAICGPSEAMPVNPNFDYIVAACNELPRLLDEVDTLKEANLRLQGERRKAAVRIEHSNECNYATAERKALEAALAAKDRRIEAIYNLCVRTSSSSNSLHYRIAIAEIMKLSQARDAKEGE